LELGNDLSELFFVELRRDLDEGLDWVGLGDSAQSTFDFLLGDLEERVTTSLEGLKLSNNNFEGLEGVFVTDLSNGVGVNIVVTGLVD